MLPFHTVVGTSTNVFGASTRVLNGSETTLKIILAELQDLLSTHELDEVSKYTVQIVFACSYSWFASCHYKRVILYLVIL